MRMKVIAIALLVAILGGAVLVPFGIAYAQTTVVNQVTDIPITGTFPEGNFEGTFDIVRFAVQRGQIVAIGNLTGTLTNTVTGVIQEVSQQIALPVFFGDATCEILELTLGPLDLDLLGLQVHLDEVHLVIEAEPGPGNLLGNLLCAIAGLLDTNGGLQGIVRLLNQILSILG